VAMRLTTCCCCIRPVINNCTTQILALYCCVLDERAFEMLEPRLEGNRVKVARTVLRGGGRSNPVSLPDPHLGYVTGHVKSNGCKLKWF